MPIHNEIRKEVLINAPQDLVWSYFSTAEKIAQWLMPNNFRGEKGAEFAMQCKLKDGSDGEIPAKILAIDPPHFLHYTWYIVDPPLATEVRVTLKTEGNATRVSLIHDGWEKLAPEYEEVRTRHESVWDMLLAQKLPELIAAGA